MMIEKNAPRAREPFLLAFVWPLAWLGVVCLLAKLAAWVRP